MVTKLDNLVTKERSPVKSIPSNVVDTIWSCSLLKESFHTLRMISQDGKDQWVSTKLKSPKKGTMFYDQIEKTKLQFLFFYLFLFIFIFGPL